LCMLIIWRKPSQMLYLSTGFKNRIQMSKETSDLPIKVGESNWVKPRDTKVFAKGKGEM
jgi:hypothetical protein